MTREEQISKAVEEIFNNADIPLEDRANLRMWYKMGANFADYNSKDKTNWSQVRIQAAIAAMQGLLACSETRGTYESFARDSVGYADALVKELKGE